MYFNVFQTLTQSKLWGVLTSLPKRKCLESVEFTIEDWVIANESPYIRFLPKNNSLIIEHAQVKQPIRLTNLRVGQLNNPTRIVCDYEFHFHISEKQSHSITNQKNLTNFMLQMNLVFTELNLTTEQNLE